MPVWMGLGVVTPVAVVVTVDVDDVVVDGAAPTPTQ